jgi:hypothetical protein
MMMHALYPDVLKLKLQHFDKLPGATVSVNVIHYLSRLSMAVGG